jgi:elongation factor G
LKIEPRTDPEAKKNFKFIDAVVGGAIPKEYVPAIGKASEEMTKK